MSWKIPLFKIYWDQTDVTSVTEALKKGMNWAIGPNVAVLEGMISNYIGTEYCVVFNSGTSALHAQLLAHNIKGGEVIVPSFTFIATANAPLFVGAKPVFADIEDKTLGLDPEDVAAKITKKTRAIIPVHYGGCPCRIKALKELAQDHKLVLIEDAAEAFGACVHQKKVGTFGDSAMFSFCQNKIITTGDGGAAVTDSKNVYEKLKLIRSHGRLETADYFSSASFMDYIQLGYNFRMSNIVAALGISQMEKVDTIIKKRRQNAHYLSEHLTIPGLTPPHPPEGSFHVYQMYTVTCMQQQALMAYLKDAGIQTKVYFHPVHTTRFYKELAYTCTLPVTESVSRSVLTLPLYPHVTKKEMDFMIDTIKEFYGVIL